ncbi:MAG: YjbQ family protein [Actinobacteria bacterium]|jgi:secondary thiamine-phosphate synthase enzyme|nr:MAG: YjbQ family protein [Actinomycetota bacterium]
MKFLFENHSFRTTDCGQFVDMTDDVRDLVARADVRNGMALVYSPHTTCAVLINERERGFIEDFGGLMESLVPLKGIYRHDDLDARTENLDDDPHDIPNGHAHCRQALLGSASQAIPIVEGELQLGRWQRVFFLELDRARDRRVLIQVMGD